MNGTMLWFNEEKGYGFIRTEEGERLYVARSGFQSRQAPVGYCAGLEVTFDCLREEGDSRAVNVVVSPAPEPRRARLRHTRVGR